MNTRREDRDGISAGRFVQPAADQLLPPVRSYKLGAGRYVPAANHLLPKTRTVKIESLGIDYEHAYHFGDQVGINFRRE